MRIPIPAAHRVRGFSLIELMVAVTIIGVLLAIALPGYQAYAVRAKRSGAQAVLLEIVSRQEQYAAANRAYLSAATSTDVESGLRMTIPADVKAAYDFRIDLQSVLGGANNAFVATATPVVGTAQAADGPLSINQFSLRQPTGKW